MMFTEEAVAAMYKRGEEYARLVERSAPGAARQRALDALESVLRALDEMEGKKRLPRVPKNMSVYAATRSELAGMRSASGDVKRRKVTT